MTKNDCKNQKFLLIYNSQSQENGEGGMEGEMEQEQTRQRHTRVSRDIRAKRIVERLRGGWAYDEIARAEGLKARRVRQIVAEFLKSCEADDDGTHARMQIERLGRAMRVAGDAMEEGDLRAIGPFIRAIDRLDRYQALARDAARKAKPTPMTKGDSLVYKEIVRRIERDVRAKIEQERLRDAREASGSPTAPDGDPAVAAAPAVAETPAAETPAVVEASFPAVEAAPMALAPPEAEAPHSISEAPPAPSALVPPPTAMMLANGIRAVFPMHRPVRL
jgi:hypothetical protein